jgi:hypothetical protein
LLRGNRRGGAQRQSGEGEQKRAEQSPSNFHVPFAIKSRQPSGLLVRKNLDHGL